MDRALNADLLWLSGRKIKLCVGFSDPLLLQTVSITLCSINRKYVNQTCLGTYDQVILQRLIDTFCHCVRNSTIECFMLISAWHNLSEFFIWIRFKFLFLNDFNAYVADISCTLNRHPDPFMEFSGSRHYRCVIYVVNCPFSQYLWKNPTLIFKECLKINFQKFHPWITASGNFELCHIWNPINVLTVCLISWLIFAMTLGFFKAIWIHMF